MSQSAVLQFDEFNKDASCGPALSNEGATCNDNASRAQAESQYHWADFSYNLLTALNSIMGVAELLKITDITDEQKQYIDIILSSGSDLQSLNEDILSLSLLEEHEHDNRQRSFDIKDILEHVMDHVSVVAAKKAIFVSSHISPAVKTSVYGNPAWLNQALINLLKMVISETDMGVVLLRVDAATGGGIQFSVKGAGPNVSAADQQMSAGYHVLSRRVEKPSRAQRHRNLRVTEQIIDRMGGDWYFNDETEDKSEAKFVLKFSATEKSFAYDC